MGPPRRSSRNRRSKYSSYEFDLSVKTTDDDINNQSALNSKSPDFLPFKTPVKRPSKRKIREFVHSSPRASDNSPSSQYCEDLNVDSILAANVNNSSQDFLPKS